MERTKLPQEDPRIESLALEAFGADSYLIVNKTLLKLFGFSSAIILSYYIDKYKYFKKNYPENNNWFFCTHEQITEDLDISEYNIVKCKQLLKEKGILIVQMKGVPAKEWLYIDFVKLVNFTTHVGGLDPQKSRGTGDGTLLGGIYNDTIKENNNRIKKKKIYKKDFIPPTIEEVKTFFSSKGCTEASAIKAFEHYALADWHDVHGDPVLFWKQKMNTVWCSKEENKINGKVKQNTNGYREFDKVYRDDGTI
jgi:hypothetical protein